VDIAYVQSTTYRASEGGVETEIRRKHGYLEYKAGSAVMRNKSQKQVQPSQQKQKDFIDIYNPKKTQKVSIEQEIMCEYMEDILLQISKIAINADQGFLAYLLNLAVQEAQSGKSRIRLKAAAA